MVYQANIPQPTDQLSKSQADLLGNFQFLNTIAAGIFDAPVQATAPIIAAGDTGLYTFFNASTGRNEMYIIDSVGNTYPITASRQAALGWTQLPSGILVAWGQLTATGGTGTFAYSTITGFPGFTMTPLSFQLTCVQTTATPNAQVYLNSFTAGANTNLQLGVTVTTLGNTPAPTSSSVQFRVWGI